MIAAKTRDLFMMIFLNRGDKNNFRKLSTRLANDLQTTVTERKHSSSFISALDYRGFYAPFQSSCIFL